MAIKRACKKCRKIYEGGECPSCGGTDSVTDFKGKVAIFNPDKSEIAKNMKIDKTGEHAIKVK